VGNTIAEAVKPDIDQITSEWTDHARCLDAAKLLKIVAQERCDEIMDIVDVILSAVPTLEIYLFGSFAKGTPREDSDYDFYVVIPDGGMRAIESEWKIQAALRETRRRIDRSIDLIVRTKDQFEDSKTYISFIERQVADTGIKLYCMDDSRDVREWISFADDDLDSAQILSSHYPPKLEHSCYHCQQAAEKALKAFLLSSGVDFPRTHNLVDLLIKCEKTDSSFVELRSECERLNSYSKQTRYPMKKDDLSELNMKAALSDAASICNFVKDHIPELTPPLLPDKKSKH